MKEYKVSFWDGESSWIEIFQAKNEDHLVALLLFEPWDINDYWEVKNGTN